MGMGADFDCPSEKSKVPRPNMEENLPRLDGLLGGDEESGSELDEDDSDFRFWACLDIKGVWSV